MTQENKHWSLPLSTKERAVNTVFISILLLILYKVYKLPTTLKNPKSNQPTIQQTKPQQPTKPVQQPISLNPQQD